MLAFEITRGGGVHITGTVRDLSALINWIALAIEANGESRPAYVTDDGLTQVIITCCDE